ncbi:shikimate kinase [Alloiococcus sp. CFN-8]|uniref:shikimate kinase n=1 Tax=Alloiococcus sp. CFN-8 TaxID=3416081 RepID=UPI003CED3B42
MKLIFLIGDAAVGKMTVGQELMKITDLRLFHNHMTIEAVIEIFGYYDWKTISRMREIIFEEFAASDNYGLIFTYMWAFDQKSNWDYVEQVTNIFKRNGTEIYYVELFASQEIRLLRNVTENRLKHKLSKRDVEASNQRLINDDKEYRCVSNDGEIGFDNYIKIDNSNVSAEAVAKMIKEYFDL